MKCPFCGHEESQVVETRLSDDNTSIRRRRQCGACEKRFTTYERAEVSMPTVVKSDGRRVDYQRQKLRDSINLALRKRPVKTQDVDDAVARIELYLIGLGGREVESRRIGEAVMHELQRLDKVAFIRYGSVYRSVGDLDAFKHLIEQAGK
ncbi:transcriptional regulator NrdR [Vandammella animalimorsus]|uniref:Transcriptional repressor NrdR n=1 Tax=Vandammella animalimorsus TaxID=2029117 RepID=A0A2A2T8L0_9BURK|nr:transcriptional regulator NrdR [Vandammella animalimorsus]RRD66798.1 transcriptional repressor NrdR [Comamonadaceae bacterium OH2310_COT-174]PAT33266.1 transcriptional regulator NrdR [Vandammella animalimorsus]PAT35947.1 transcriptional regulator NrdR [Vandammella animalimorsus]PAT44075.1 transcriptional regulator NrdR [Vandammella animalimorsus]PAX18496.1 transcriptional regulator NrdR [Vandammella animalimorsus]